MPRCSKPAGVVTRRESLEGTGGLRVRGTTVSRRPRVPPAALPGRLRLGPGRLVMTVLAFTCAGRTPAQTLDLPARLNPPALDGDTSVARLVAALEGEIDELARAERSMPADRRGFARGAIDTRLLALQLLAGHELTGPRIHVRTLAGVRLAGGRALLDAMLDEAAGLDPAGVAAALDALEHFNTALVDHASALREAGVLDLDVVLPRVVAPLARAGGGVLPGVPVSHWPRAHAESTPPGDDAALAEAVDDLVRRFAVAGVPEAARADVDTMLSFVRRGVSYPDYRPDVERLRRLLEDLLALVVTLDEAVWMDAAQAEAYRTAVVGVVAAIRDPRTRQGGVHALRRLEHSRSVIGRITALAAGAEDTRALGRGLASMDDVDFARAAAADVPPDPPPALARLAAVLDDIIASRAADNAELPRDLRPAFARLKRSCQVAERAVLEELAKLVDDDAMADPALHSFVADHSQYAEDIARLRRLPGIMTVMETMSAGAATPVRTRVRRTCGWLADPGRREGAVRTLDDLERRVAAARPLPFEAALRGGDRPAIIAAGGRHVELLETMDAARAAWVDAWAVDDAAEAPAARRLELLVRLVRLMSDSADALEMDGAGITIDRWAGWGLPRRLVLRAAADLPNRLKLATVSAIDRDDPALADQLDRIERDAPLVRLAGLLARVLAGDLNELPDGARGLLGQLVHPPPRDALLGEERLRIAELCRYAIEAAFAWDEGRNDRAAELQRYVNALADEIRGAIE